VVSEFIRGPNVGAMNNKKKAKGKKAPKKVVKKAPRKKSRARAKKETNPAEVRKEVSKIVASEAVQMTNAVVGEAKKGQLAPMKYLFEMAGVYPSTPNGEQATAEEDCLAKTLLDRLTAPRKAEEADEDAEEEESAGDAAKNGAADEAGDGGAGTKTAATVLT